MTCICGSSAFASSCSARVKRLFTQPDAAADSAWLPNHLEYQFAIGAPMAPDTIQTVLVADQYHQGRVDWYSFAAVSGGRAALSSLPMPRTELFTRLRHAIRVADRLERADVSTEEAMERAAEAAWSRRRFLGTSAAAVAGAAIGFPRIARAQEAGDLRVVILGAGTAGLTCAYRLQQSGISATILEASPRVGGRMYSLLNFFPDDQTAELGGELIDTDHYAIRNLAQELGLELIDLAYLDGSTGHDYFIDGKLYREENGFMNSAVESGERAATQVLGALGRGQVRAA